MLLNTSLNIKGKPIVNNRFHAIKFEKNIMLKLYNLGCSFSYGNCASELNTLIDEHKSTSTYIAEFLI